MTDLAAAIRTLGAAKALGSRISVDDFGTGHSSLASLKRLPVDTLKIDRSFIQNTPHDPDDCAIVQAIVALGRALQLSVLAEGVETAQQVAYLTALGCNEFQGYYFSRPLDPDAVEALLAAHGTAVAG